MSRNIELSTPDTSGLDALYLLRDRQVFSGQQIVPEGRERD